MVVSNFNGHLLVHIQKFNGDFPTKEGSACSPTNTSSYWTCWEEAERNPQPWTDAHKKSKMCCNGGTTGQGVLYTIENNSNKQLAIKVNMSLTP